ncbi:hypothetical protein [Clostridium cuniculi]|uniref:hypothetical protein n=1 Tax=Clostridium cuniculi TaxID=2548455 RepID=UPI0010562B92|nr:hypothetical protein [Clostridium cuniculi]
MSKEKDKCIILDPKNKIAIKKVRCMDRKIRRFISIDKKVKCLECDSKINVSLMSEKLKGHLCKYRGFR